MKTFISFKVLLTTVVIVTVASTPLTAGELQKNDPVRLSPQYRQGGLREQSSGHEVIHYFNGPVEQAKGCPSRNAYQPADADGVPVKFISQQESNEIGISELFGAPVVGSNGKKIAEISDLILDHNNHIKVVIITTGGFLGFGQRQIGLGRDALYIRSWSDGQSAMVNLTESDLVDAPDFVPRSSVNRNAMIRHSFEQPGWRMLDFRRNPGPVIRLHNFNKTFL